MQEQTKVIPTTVQVQPGEWIINAVLTGDVESFGRTADGKSAAELTIAGWRSDESKDRGNPVQGRCTLIFEADTEAEVDAVVERIDALKVVSLKVRPVDLDYVQLKGQHFKLLEVLPTQDDPVLASWLNRLKNIPPLIDERLGEMRFNLADRTFEGTHKWFNRTIDFCFDAAPAEVMMAQMAILETLFSHADMFDPLMRAWVVEEIEDKNLHEYFHEEGKPPCDLAFIKNCVDRVPILKIEVDATGVFYFFYFDKTERFISIMASASLSDPAAGEVTIIRMDEDARHGLGGQVKSALN